ncbi:MAG TPA: hypothetical protein VHC20_04535 [Candidatus Paceibacterota bacterium]|nr:hypothetical protein [Candidatus Paceibacterota bacterium]
MSRSRHKNRASGGKVTAYAGGDSNVMKEAHERKRGGRVHEVEGEKSHKGAHARARGGQVPGRKRGGGIGANLTPLSTAARTKKLSGEEAGTEGGGHKGSEVHNP